MVILSGELPGLVFVITSRQFEPASTRSVEYAICPSIEADRESLLCDIIGAGSSTDVCTFTEVE